MLDHCVDQFTRLDLNIMATLAALTMVHDWVQSQHIRIEVSMRDISFKDLWQCRTIEEDVSEWRHTQDATYDPAFYGTTLAQMSDLT